MKVAEIMGMFLARRDNYSVSHIQHLHGDVWNITMHEQAYRAAILPVSFDFYEKRYHLAREVPTLVICWQHTTCLPVKVLALREGEITEPFELPTSITDIEVQRTSKLGHKVLLGMYLSGMRLAQQIVKDAPATTRKRYLAQAESYGKRKRGKPVGLTPTTQNTVHIV